MSTSGDRDETPDEAQPKPEKPIMPTAAEARATATGAPTPRPVRYGVNLLFVSGFVCLIAGVFAILIRQKQIDYLVQHPQGQNLTRDQIAQGVTVQIALLIVAAVVYGAFIWLFSAKIRGGDRRSRTRLTVVVLLLGLYQYLFGINYIDPIGVLLGVIGLVMLFVPSVKGYFVKS